MALVESQEKLSKGDVVPGFDLPGTDGKNDSLEDFKGARAVLIVFMCNHCPYVLGKLPELNKIHRDFKDRGLVVIGINSNDAENYPEDSFEKMQEFVEEGKVEFLYLRDESQKVAKAYGAVCTPDPFLIDGEFKLIFHSRVGDPPSPKESTREELYEAIGEFLEKGKITVEEMPSAGCSIKWK